MLLNSDNWMQLDERVKNKSNITFIISARSTVAGVLSGTISIRDRIENVRGFRVEYFNITTGTALTNVADGNILHLRSNKLGSLSGDNAYYLASGVDSSTLAALPVNTIIGLTSPASASSVASNFLYAGKGSDIMFNRTTYLDFFDWSITAEGPITTPVSYAVEIVITFFQC